MYYMLLRPIEREQREKPRKHVLRGGVIVSATGEHHAAPGASRKTGSTRNTSNGSKYYQKRKNKNNKKEGWGSLSLGLCFQGRSVAIGIVASYRFQPRTLSPGRLPASIIKLPPVWNRSPEFSDL